MPEVKFDLISELATSEAFRNYVRDLYKDEYLCSYGKEKKMTNLNCVEAIPCATSGDNVKPETAKSVLEEMDGILKELFNELRRIDDAIYSPRNVGEADDSKQPKQECLLGTLDRQRLVAKASLDLAVHIREGLW